MRIPNLLAIDLKIGSIRLPISLKSSLEIVTGALVSRRCEQNSTHFVCYSAQTFSRNPVIRKSRLPRTPVTQKFGSLRLWSLHWADASCLINS